MSRPGLAYNSKTGEWVYDHSTHLSIALSSHSNYRGRGYGLNDKPFNLSGVRPQGTL